MSADANLSTAGIVCHTRDMETDALSADVLAQVAARQAEVHCRMQG